MPDTLTLVLLAVIFLLAALFVHYRFCKPKAADLIQADQLRAWVAETLSDLSPEAREAVELFSWAEKTNWLVVSQNVALNKTGSYPRAKEALQ